RLRARLAAGRERDDRLAALDRRVRAHPLRLSVAHHHAAWTDRRARDPVGAAPALHPGAARHAAARIGRALARLSRLLRAALLLAARAARVSAARDLARLAAGTIHLSADAAAPVVLAANELARYLARIFGREP